MQALKGTSIPEKYKLYWPPSSRPEFVRFAAKFGATIIPFGAVGAEDQVKTVMSADSLEWVRLLNCIRKLYVDSRCRLYPQGRHQLQEPGNRCIHSSCVYPIRTLLAPGTWEPCSALTVRASTQSGHCQLQEPGNPAVHSQFVCI